MRISTMVIYDQSVSSIHRQQSKFIDLGQQLASGKRVIRPSDDPQAASRAVGVAQAQSVTGQYTDARGSVRNSLSQEAGVLGGVSDALTRANTLLVQASNDSNSDVDRNTIATELRGVLENILGQANSTDGNGRYLFGGYINNTPPFVKDGAGNIDYMGDTNVRGEQVDASRIMAASDNGDTIFRRVHSGAGYVGEADPGNGGNLTFKGPEIIDADDPGFGANYTINFSVAADGSASYSINGDPAQPYATDDGYIEVGGVRLELEGMPADGDSITMAPAEQMNTDLFATLNKAIAVLETPAATDTEIAARRNTLNTTMRELGNSFDNIQTVSASVGSRLNELDTIDSVADKRELNYTQTLSDLIALDELGYVETISEYQQRQVGLQAAQKTFVDLSGLSLFKHI